MTTNTNEETRTLETLRAKALRLGHVHRLSLADYALGRVGSYRWLTMAEARTDLLALEGVGEPGADPMVRAQAFEREAFANGDSKASAMADRALGGCRDSLAEILRRLEAGEVAGHSTTLEAEAPNVVKAACQCGLYAHGDDESEARERLGVLHTPCQ